MKYLFILLIIFSIASAKSQTQNQKPCSATEASQFDFWVGDWGLTWNAALDAGGVLVSDEVRINAEIQLIKQVN